MRPETHRHQVPPRRCGNCRHGIRPEYKDHRLCFLGDAYTTYPAATADCLEVSLGETIVGLTDGDEYDRIWGGRVVDDTDVCDCWLADDGPSDAPPDAVGRARDIVAANEWSGDMRANMTTIIGAGRVLSRALALQTADLQALRWRLKEDRRSAQPAAEETSDDRDEAEYLYRFCDWILARIADTTDGCLTGDCPHDSQRDCVVSLLRRFERESANGATEWLED